MKKYFFISVICASILFTGCTEEEKQKAVDDVTTTIETKLKEMNLEEEAKDMAEKSLTKIQETYEGEAKVMMDNAYKFGKEYTKAISEQAKATLKEMAESTNTTTAPSTSN